MPKCKSETHITFLNLEDNEIKHEEEILLKPSNLNSPPPILLPLEGTGCSPSPLCSLPSLSIQHFAPTYAVAPPLLVFYSQLKIYLH